MNVLLNGAPMLYKAVPTEVNSTGQILINAFVTFPMPLRVRAGDEVWAVGDYLSGGGTTTPAEDVTMELRWAI